MLFLQNGLMKKNKIYLLLMITVESHYGISVLRDDLLIGGTKSILMSSIDNDANIDEFVYASPVYGGFQIALSAYCKSVGKKATIFCSRRKERYPNTVKCIEYGANIIEVYPGYLSVVEKRAREYCNGKKNVKKLVFGARSDENINFIAERTRRVIKQLGKDPDEIWIAIGSGTLISGILQGVSENVKVIGIQVGKDFIPDEDYKNLTIIKYLKPFEYESKLKVDFPSMPNYDLKAFELCLNNNINCGDKTVLFWNVL